MSFALRAARVLTPGHELEDTWVTVDEGLITAVGAEPPAHAHRLDLGDCDLIPGLVDLHSDCLEERAHPRPSSPLPLGAALLHLDAEVAAHAITTHFLCASFEDDAAQHRSPARAAEIVRTVRAWRRQLRVEHRVHLRIETSVDELDRAGALAADDAVGLVSYMDHSPGQGQYPDERAWRAHFAERLGHDGPAVAELAARRLAAQADGDARRRRIAALALRAGAVLASHDDAGEEDVARAVALGTAISEFPLNAHAARTASEAGLGVVMGAPNAYRGRSHLVGLSARDALRAGHLHALASDYHPPALLAAAYRLADDGVCDLAHAVALVSARPAALARLDDRGAIEPGRRADLAAVALVDGLPVVRQTWRTGQPVLGLAPADAAAASAPRAA